MKILLVANWKANPASFKEAVSLFNAVRSLKKKNQEIVICAPQIFTGFLRSSAIKIGAQDVSKIEGGPYTGEVTAEMLKIAGISYCIVGHSERRKRGESSQMV